MTVEFDWVTFIERAGIAGICFAVIYFGYKLFELFMGQWKNSTDAVNKNTEAFTRLSSIFEKQVERELEYQEKSMALLKDGVYTAKDTNEKVTEIHRQIVK